MLSRSSDKIECSGNCFLILLIMYSSDARSALVTKSISVDLVFLDEILPKKSFKIFPALNAIFNVKSRYSE